MIFLRFLEPHQVQSTLYGTDQTAGFSNEFEARSDVLIDAGVCRLAINDERDDYLQGLDSLDAYRRLNKAGLYQTQGLSAYQIAVAAGFVGDEDDWLATLIGPKGDAGTTPAKAIGSEINTGTDDAKFVTSKALADAGFVLDSDVTLAADSDSKVATQKAVKAYIDAAIAGLP